MAQTLTWDTDTGAGVTSGSGNWNTTTDNWTTDGGGTNTTFTNGDSVEFGDGGSVTPPITVVGTVQTPQLTFNDDGFVLNGGTIGSVGTTNIQISSGADTATISSALQGNFSTSGNGTLVLSGTSASLANFSVANSFDVENTGTIGGNVGNAGGLLNSGTIGGFLINSSTANLTATSSVGGSIVNSGTLNAAGTLLGNAVNNGGTFTVTGNMIMPGSVDNNNGTFNVNANLTANSVTNNGDLNVSAGNTLTSTLGFTNESGGDFNIFGAYVGDVLNQSGGDINLQGSLTGDVVSGGSFGVSGTMTGDVTNSGFLDVNGTMAGNAINTGLLDVSGTLTGNITNSSTVGVSGTVTGNVGNAVGSFFTNTGTLDGTLTNAGQVNTAGGTFTGLVQNTGAISSDGSLVLGAGLQNDGVVSLGVNGTSGDTLTINGDLSGNGAFVLDVNLDETNPTPSSDTVVVSGGAITGSVAVNFSQEAGTGALLADDLLIIDADDTAANSFSVTSSGLPDTTSAVLYALSQDDLGNVYLFDRINPAISAIAGNVALTQSLIGAVVNRPSSPFVSGLAFKDEKPCGTGLWTRALGGHAETVGSTDDDDTSIESRITSNYYGVQLGGDFACFNGAFHGWDVALGGIGGMNQGTTYQPVFALDPITLEPLLDSIASITEGDFDQFYGGIYAIAVHDRLAFDLQYRMEYTDFNLTNSAGGGGAGLGLTNGNFDSLAHTISGAASYSMPVGETPLTIVPTVGFAYTATSTSQIVFDNGSTLDLDDAQNLTGFAGATASWTKVAKSGKWALNSFVTGTYYNDFVDGLSSTFTDNFGSQETLASTNLGAYSELSAGLNFVRLLDTGDFGPVRQINASLRTDLRVGESLDGWGVTGQMRFQF